MLIGVANLQLKRNCIAGYLWVLLDINISLIKAKPSEEMEVILGIQPYNP